MILPFFREVLGFSVQVSGLTSPGPDTIYETLKNFLFRSDWTLAAGGARMKLRLAGPVKRLNVEHRTSNIERRILMTLCFIDFKTSEPQNL